MARCTGLLSTGGRSRAWSKARAAGLVTALATSLTTALAAIGLGLPAAARAQATLPDSVLPTREGLGHLPDAWLLGTGQPWHHRIARAPDGQALPLGRREPRDDERAIVQAAQQWLDRSDGKLLMLLDGRDLVAVLAKPPVHEQSLLLSASMAKTLTAMGAGRAVCAGRLGLDSRAGDVVPALRGTDLGRATLADLLTMRSGTTEPRRGDPHGLTLDEDAAVREGRTDYQRLIAGGRLAKAASQAPPGQRFAYKSTDPLVVAMMVREVSGQPFAHWIESEVLAAVPIQGPAVIGQDHAGHADASGSVRLDALDWARLAVHLREQRAAPGCFGDFLRRASSTQAANPRDTAPAFGGYGFFVWTDTRFAPETFWAAGWGGQRIGWSTRADNPRVLLTFGNTDRAMPELYRLAATWIGR